MSDDVFTDDIFSPDIFTFPDGERIFVDPPAGPQIGIPVNIGTASNTTDDTSVTITVGAAGVPANVTIFVDSVHEGTDDVSHTCSDNVNGAYAVDVVPVENATIGNVINGRRFRFSNNAALVQNDTITISWTGLSGADAARAYYVEGLDLTDPLTGTPVGAEGAGTDPVDSGDLTTVDPNAIILGFLSRRGFIADGYTEDVDFTTFSTPVEADTGLAGTSRVLHTAFRIVSATETQNYASTIGVPRFWAAGISAYKAAG